MLASNLTNALSEKFQEKGQLVNQFEGEIEPDSHSDFFRLYPFPNDRSLFFRIPKTADHAIYEWSADEILHAGLRGQRRFRVDLAHGATIQKVMMESLVVGQQDAKAASCFGNCWPDQQIFCKPGCKCNSANGGVGGCSSA